MWIYMYVWGLCSVEVRRHTLWSRVRFHGCWLTHSQFHSQFHSWRHSLCITLTYTTLVRMRSSYAWTMKPWQRSEWRLGFNSVLVGSWMVHGMVWVGGGYRGEHHKRGMEVHEVVTGWTPTNPETTCTNIYHLMEMIHSKNSAHNHINIYTPQQTYKNMKIQSFSEPEKLDISNSEASHNKCPGAKIFWY